MMTTKFFSTNNRRWFAVRPPKGKRGSERTTLYSWIAAQSGIGSAELEARWCFATSMRSRLKELEDAGFIRSERVSDLFAFQPSKERTTQ